MYGADGSISYAVVQDKKGVPMSYSLILTGASIVHRDYFNMFGETVPPEIINMIDTLVDGEDLTFNVMVGDYLSRLGMPQTPGLLIGKVNVQFIADQASKLEHFYYMFLCQIHKLKTPGLLIGKVNVQFIADQASKLEHFYYMFLCQIHKLKTPGLLIGKVNVQFIADQASKLEHFYYMLLCQIN